MHPKPLYCWFVAIVLWLGLLSPSYAASSTDPKLLHVIDRLSFGPHPGDIKQVQQLGADAYIQQQLHPESIPEPPTLTEQIAQLDTLNLTPLQLFEQSRLHLPKGQKPTPEQRKAARLAMRRVMEQAMRARFLRATESPRQLQEVMVDFWFNHFNVFSGKGIDGLLVGSYEQEAIRPHVLGHFRDLLEATARHPAMLYYLDNWQNVAPNTGAKRGASQGLNENYARELMELHTLGVDGGYTQQDVIALAKIFTGWTFRRSAQPGVDADGFFFDAKRHDSSDKQFLGHTIKGSGIAEAEQALDILAKSPATAHHISYQLAQYFVADQPPSSLVDRLAKRFLATDGDIREVLNTLFHSPEFNDRRYYEAKFKTPYQYAISSVRATGIAVTNFRPIYGLLQQLGMPLYGWATPDGYKNTADVWLNPDAMTRRISFATALASGRLPLLADPVLTYPAENSQSGKMQANKEVMLGGTVDRVLRKMVTANPSSRFTQPIDATQLANTLGNAFSATTEKTLTDSPETLRAALILGSPEFMRY